MTTWKNNNRGLRLFFAVAVVVHVVFILAPLTEEIVSTEKAQPAVRVTLQRVPATEKANPAAKPEPLLDWRTPAVPGLEALPPVPEQEVLQPQAVTKVVQKAESPSSKRVLSSQFDYGSLIQKPLFDQVQQPRDQPDFYLRQRPSLEMVLNQPSIQLPFEDTRIYLVDSYANGIEGKFERFWDTVSVPFGFTTKNNTRVQCVWVLVIAGCGWGHKTQFYRPARYREQPEEPRIENT